MRFVIPGAAKASAHAFERASGRSLPCTIASRRPGDIAPPPLRLLGRRHPVPPRSQRDLDAMCRGLVLATGQPRWLRRLNSDVIPASPRFFDVIPDGAQRRAGIQAGSGHLDQRFAALQCGKNRWQQSIEPAQQLLPGGIAQPYPHHGRIIRAHHATHGEVLVLGNDACLAVHCMRPHGTVGGPLEAAIDDMLRDVARSESRRASAGGSCASTRKRIKPPAGRDGRSA